MLASAGTDAEHLPTHYSRTVKKLATITQFEIFTATVDCGSLVKAARQLNLTPSAVSKQLSALENELGVMLLERRPWSLQITEPGHLFYQRCRQILAQVHDAKREVQDKRDDVSGQITLTVATPLVKSQLPQLLTQFNRLYPDIHFNLHVNDETEDLVTGRMDFAFRIGKKLADNRLHAIPLADTRPTFCASPEYIQNFGMPTSLSDLRRHQIALISSINLSPILNRIYGDTKQIRRCHITNDVNMIFSMMQSGLCISAALDIMIKTELEIGKLVNVFPDKLFPTKKLYLIYAKQGKLPKKIKLFKDYIKQQW